MNDARHELTKTNLVESAAQESPNSERPAYHAPRIHALGGLEKVKASHYSADYYDSYGWMEYR